MTETEVTDICSEIASLMISSGAEIYRVEDTTARICRAYGYDRAEIYATPVNFIITVKDKKGRAYTDTKSLSGRETDLDRVGALNQLSRFICKEKPSHSEVKRAIGGLKDRKKYPLWVVYVSFVLVGASFAAYYGGSLTEIVCAAALAAMVKLMEDRLKRLGAGGFLSSTVCSMATALAAVIITKAGAAESYDTIIIGAFMTMVPGVVMANCMRDFISGDFFSGIYTLTEALLTAVGMAVGAGIAVVVSG
ncbi:MAG: threonine/serine exporter family protein [Oscillospiraceae bacterium]|nr:threonine/serine exporter family protein [Oscillospiraceae bacterium]